MSLDDKQIKAMIASMKKVEPPSPEEMQEKKKEDYKEYSKTPENMSYWITELSHALRLSPSTFLKSPSTMVIQLPFEWFDVLTEDKPKTQDQIKSFNDYLVSRIESNESNLFTYGDKLFIKTGIFSDKFTFHHAVVNDWKNIGEQFMKMYYNSMVLGAHSTNEFVARSFIEPEEGRPSIYEGMPLHTEFRFFFDFDNNEMLGVSNYWHPDLMHDNLMDEEKETYASVEPLIQEEFHQHHPRIAQELEDVLPHMSIPGKWSIDVMKRGDDYFIIDMARMERSALRHHMIQYK